MTRNEQKRHRQDSSRRRWMSGLRPRSATRRLQIEGLEDRRLLSGPTFTEYPVNTTGMPGITDLVEGPDGNMWFTVPNDIINPFTGAGGPGNLIGELIVNPTKPSETVSQVLTYPIPTPISQPAHIVSYFKGLDFTEFNGNNIGVIDPSTGSITEYPLPAAESANQRIPSAPFGIATGIGPGGVGDIWFTLSSFNGLGDFDNTIGPQGGYIIDPLGGGGVVPSGSRPLEIKAGLDFGTLWFNLENVGSNAVGSPGESTLALMTLGGIIDENVPEAGSWADFTVGADGNIWGVRGSVIDRVIPGPAPTTPYSFVNPGSTTASVTTFNLGPGAPAVSITSGNDGCLWFTDSDGGIGRVTIDGTVTRYATPTPGPNGPITVGPDGNIWFVEQSGTTSHIVDMTYPTVDYSVTRSDDSLLVEGHRPSLPMPGTLRFALQYAGATPGPHSIAFDIPGPGPHTIELQEDPLPALTTPFTIDAGALGSVIIDGSRAPSGRGPIYGSGLVLESGGNVIRGLGITGFYGDGIHISSDDNVIENMLVTDNTGVAAGTTEGRGIVIFGSGNLVQGNVVSGNAGIGIEIVGIGNLVQGNFIGTDASGTIAIPNANGIFLGAGIVSPGQNTIGGTTAAARNIISGNRGSGISSVANTGVLIEGNYIGTDVSGTRALPNGVMGVTLTVGSQNTIGGTGAGAGNVISGNQYWGIDLEGELQDVVEGNFIGTDASGTFAIPNAGHGVALSNGASSNTIGGTSSSARNVISGNQGDGVRIRVRGADNWIEGNFIGLDVSGSAALGNGGNGVSINGGQTSGSGGGSGSSSSGSSSSSGGSGSSSSGGSGSVSILGSGDGNVIGGSASAARNVISGNRSAGIYISQGSMDLVAGNLIGTDASGTTAIPNAGDGVDLVNGTLNSTIGGTSPGAGNTIAFNGGNGVTVGLTPDDLSTGNSILTNAIFANSRLGIDLGDDGVTLNDSMGHNGPNLFQDFPVLTSVNAVGGVTTITGSLSGAARTTYRVELFSNPGTDPSGHGQSQTFLTAADVTTDASGKTRFSIPTAGSIPAGQSITATATDPKGNTSEFSTNLVVSALKFNSISAISPDPRNTPVASVTVTFSGPIKPGSFTTSDLTLTDNGGPNLVTSAVTISLVSGTTYRIGGLAGLAASEGRYTLTVDAAGIQDQNGSAGTGSASTTWLMDATAPTSHASALPKSGTSLSFAVSVTGLDPNGAGGSPPSGVASYDLYSSTNGGPWTLWTTVPASSPTATFTGQSNAIYAFYSLAHDLAGNTEKKKPAIETSTFLPDLTPPATSVNSTTGTSPSTVDTGTGAFTLSLSGSDAGGSGLTYFEAFVAIDAQPPVSIGPAIPSGSPDQSRVYHATLSYEGLTDDVTHQYRFFSIGIDSAGNTEAAHAAPNDVTFSESFAQPAALQVVGLTVEHGAAERSFIRYLDIAFNESDAQSGGQLTALAGSLGTAVQLARYDLNATPGSKVGLSLAGVTATVVDHVIELDFGAAGLGGNASTTAADGYYELDVTVGTTTDTHHFYRLLGDVTGNGVVDNDDLTAIASALALSAPTGYTPLSADVNGDGTVTSFDIALATRAKGHRLGSGLPLG